LCKPGYKSINAEIYIKNSLGFMKNLKGIGAQRDNKLLWLSYKYDGADDAKV
jgi:hypothetical protein